MTKEELRTNDEKINKMMKVIAHDSTHDKDLNLQQFNKVYMRENKHMNTLLGQD